MWPLSLDMCVMQRDENLPSVSPGMDLAWFDAQVVTVSVLLVSHPGESRHNNNESSCWKVIAGDVIACIVDWSWWSCAAEGIISAHSDVPSGNKKYPECAVKNDDEEELRRQLFIDSAYVARTGLCSSQEEEDRPASYLRHDVQGSNLIVHCYSLENKS